ncbi:hypothetical protein WJX72_005124 [[Myrmecia] bisecta]|uniref:RRM domain-containing protein n=1 Tax=[Myrmecia] bisecta TaxID=41462 RepID=A0AAW1PSB1_9CHLO
MAARKVLLSGPCHGKLSALFKRVAAVNKSNGPFDVLLCSGQFFAAGDEADQEDTELQAYLDGSKPVPVPTYFIGAHGKGARKAMQALAAANSDRINYLGRAGVQTVAGLTVAYLDGSQLAVSDGQKLLSLQYNDSCLYYNEDDVRRVKAAADAAGDVDVFLTCEWPEGITSAVPSNTLPEALTDHSGSKTVSELALSVRPRYHVAGSKPVFFARLPYMNRDLGVGAHASRFVGLAAVGNADKQKSLHALALVPAADMVLAALTQKPEGCTASPYENAVGGKRQHAEDENLGEQSWRWQDNKRQKPNHAAPSLGRPGVVKDDKCTIYVKNLPFRAEEGDLEAFFAQCGKVVDVRRGLNAEGKLNGFGFIQFATASAVERACQLSGQELMGRELYIDTATATASDRQPVIGKPVEGCWFCLSNPNADTSLVASIGEECYMAVDKGAITPMHVLLVPIEHYPNTLTLSASCYAEMERYLSALQTCYASQGMDLVAFERYMKFLKTGGNHCHLNVMAIPTAAAAKARQAFESSAAANSFSFTALPAGTRGEASREALRAEVGDGEYLLIVLPGGARLVHPISRGERIAVSFGRQVIAELAGVPDRADWKTCALSPEEEQKQTEAFKALFKPYDIMQ